MIIDKELTDEWDVQSVFSLASNDLLLKQIQIGKLYDCRLKG